MIHSLPCTGRRGTDTKLPGVFEEEAATEPESDNDSECMLDAPLQHMQIDERKKPANVTRLQAQAAAPAAAVPAAAPASASAVLTSAAAHSQKAVISEVRRMSASFVDGILCSSLQANSHPNTSSTADEIDLWTS